MTQEISSASGVVVEPMSWWEGPAETGPAGKGKLVTPEEGKDCSIFLVLEQDFLAEKLLSGRRG